MVKKTVMAICAGVLGCSLAFTANAANLMQVYGQALHSDPTFKQAESTWWSTKQNLPIAIAAYLPQINATYNWSRVYDSNTPSVTTTDGWHTQHNLNLTASQPIFNFGAWVAIQQASSQVKAATATYLAAIQSLMQRTANAYFAVLQAEDELIFTIANKRAVKRNLTTAEQQYKVGLIAITGVYDAKSRYDQASATEISDRNAVYNALENLRAITGQHYSSLMGIHTQVPLIMPIPNDINAWVRTAEHQNYTLQSQEYTVTAAKQQIKIAASAFLPTAAVQNSYTYIKNYNYGKDSAVASGANTRNVADTWGLQVNWNMLNGGADYYTTKQTRYNYLTAVGLLEFNHRDVVSQTRQSFFGIVSSISKIKADYLSIVSFKKTLQATEAGYQVGTRTMVDVLNAIADVYRSENTYMDDQYAYMNDIINLKNAAGTLSEKDLKKLNSWLNKKYSFNLPRIYYNDIGRPARPLKSYSGTVRVNKPDVDLHMTSFNSKKPYTIQFYSANRLKSAERYRAKSNLHKNLKIVKVKRRYKVVYGHYKTRSDALVALDALPIDHTKYHVWIARMAAPQQAPTAKLAKAPKQIVPVQKPIQMHHAAISTSSISLPHPSSTT